jgi:hypothetical protein
MKSMISRFEQVSYASVPAIAVAVLADVRCLPQVQVALVGERAWIRFPPGNEQVLNRLLPVRGGEFFVLRDGLWYRHGCHLPCFDLPIDAKAQPLDLALTPAAVEPQAAPRCPVQPVPLRLVPDNRPRQTTAMTCSKVELASWAEGATTASLTSIRGAISGDRVLLLGRHLPLFGEGARFWGGRLLAPLGYQVVPALPENEMLEALGVAEDAFLILSAERAEVIPQNAFEPLTRTGVRLALGEGS